ncbi:hypothetical protein GCM10022402_16500 [Salinactinospora qingdaonensis]|uniref:Uncharacterized protein n=1 Tax=Salinactinospora qingdaonensis TaxID=702744 RepID=A0ABP7FFF2_9ACTN
MRHDIPWEEVKSIGSDGRFTVKTSSGEEIGSIQYGGALLGELTGYPSHRKAIRLSREMLEKSSAAPSSPSDGVPPEKLSTGKLHIPFKSALLLILAFVLFVSLIHVSTNGF